MIELIKNEIALYSNVKCVVARQEQIIITQNKLEKYINIIEESIMLEFRKKENSRLHSLIVLVNQIEKNRLDFKPLEHETVVQVFFSRLVPKIQIGAFYAEKEFDLKNNSFIQDVVYLSIFYFKEPLLIKKKIKEKFSSERIKKNLKYLDYDLSIFMNNKSLFLLKKETFWIADRVIEHPELSSFLLKTLSSHKSINKRKQKELFKKDKRDVVVNIFHDFFNVLSLIDNDSKFYTFNLKETKQLFDLIDGKPDIENVSMKWNTICESKDFVTFFRGFLVYSEVVKLINNKVLFYNSIAKLSTSTSITFSQMKAFMTKTKPFINAIKKNDLLKENQVKILINLETNQNLTEEIKNYITEMISLFPKQS